MTGTLQTLSSVLQELQSANALQIAAVVGMDGLLVDAAAAENYDAELIGAVAAPGLLMMSDLAKELGEGMAEMTMMEYSDHIVAMMPLNEDALLVAVADSGAMNLGQIRIILRRQMDTLRGAVSGA